MEKFILKSPFKPTGDQPQAIEKLVTGLRLGLKHQVLLGVTGSGKTFTMANVIARLNRPTLVISHNKTLAAQLAQEYREFFPKNAVEYFVSYYDYYQPESYIPQRDQYIEKEADINEEIEKLRLATTAALLSRPDVIVVASVSCIYNLGSPVEYRNSVIKLERGRSSREELIKSLVDLFYTRSEFDFARSTFRVRGEHLDLWPSDSDEAIRVSFSSGNKIERVEKISPVTGKTEEVLNKAFVFPAKHYITAKSVYEKAMAQIGADLDGRVAELQRQRKPLEAQRLSQRTKYDLEMLAQVGYCSGIENYSRYFDQRRPGDPPYTLLDYFPADYLLIIDESHLTVPQIRGMYHGDRSRKATLIDYGFRLPSAADNRPLKFDEFWRRVSQVIYTSATPEEWEVHQATLAANPSKMSKSPIANLQSQMSSGVVEQLIRPTGLLDPAVEIRKTKGQIDDLVKEIKTRVLKKERTLVTTLTKRLAEELTAYLVEQGFKVQYLHADVKTLERSDILTDLRQGRYDVVVGINLLREGLDLPEVALVAILDADQEGFLRSETSLIQTMGRAARHVHGQVLMYAETVTGSMRRAMAEVNRRRQVQAEYNRRHRITPRSIEKPLRKRLIEKEADGDADESTVKAQEFLAMSPSEREGCLKMVEAGMKAAAEVLDFELAVRYRDNLRQLKSLGKVG